MPRYPEVVAALLGVLTVALVVTTFLVDPQAADALTREDGPIEWLQVALFAAAATFALESGRRCWRAGASPVLEVVLTALLCGLIIGEIDLDRIVFGRKIISTRFLVDGQVWLGWRALAVVVMVAPPALVALYALWRRTQLLSGARRALVEPSGRVLLTGLLVFALTEAFEQPLGQVRGLPRYMLEEVLELLAAICLVVGLHARGVKARARRERPLV